MSDSPNFGFAKLVPGFDFLQNLAKGAGGGLAQMPQLSKWVAPTLDVEELEKRIQELKAVQFWLEQNGKALSATIQAMEVQKMTLSTLQGMNLSMGDLAESLKLRPEMMASAFGVSAADGAGASAAAKTGAQPAAAKTEKAAKAAQANKTTKANKAGKAGAASASDAAAQVDPLQWWGALSQQFQEIAASALKDVAEAGASAQGSKSTKATASSKAAPAPAPGAARKRAAPASKRRTSAG